MSFNIDPKTREYLAEIRERTGHDMVVKKAGEWFEIWVDDKEVCAELDISTAKSFIRGYLFGATADIRGYFFGATAEGPTGLTWTKNERMCVALHIAQNIWHKVNKGIEMALVYYGDINDLNWMLMHVLNRQSRLLDANKEKILAMTGKTEAELIEYAKGYDKLNLEVKKA